jgi:RNA binding exosome subunit
MGKKAEETIKTLDPVIIELGPKQLEILKQIKVEKDKFYKTIRDLVSREELIVISTVESLKIEGVTNYHIDLDKGQLKLEK